MPLIIHRVLVTFRIVATPFATSVLLPVDPDHAITRVSVVIAIVRVHAEVSFTIVMADPIGNATEEFAGMVKVLGVVSAEGWYICFP